jgi:hypothetical protein
MGCRTEKADRHLLFLVLPCESKQDSELKLYLNQSQAKQAKEGDDHSLR